MAAVRFKVMAPENLSKAGTEGEGEKCISEEAKIQRFAQGYIFLQIPCFLGREKNQPKLKMGKKLRREQ